MHLHQQVTCGPISLSVAVVDAKACSTVLLSHCRRDEQRSLRFVSTRTSININIHVLAL